MTQEHQKIEMIDPIEIVPAKMVCNDSHVTLSDIPPVAEVEAPKRTINPKSKAQARRIIKALKSGVKPDVIAKQLKDEANLAKQKVANNRKKDKAAKKAKKISRKKSK